MKRIKLLFTTITLLFSVSNIIAQETQAAQETQITEENENTRKEISNDVLDEQSKILIESIKYLPQGKTKEFAVERNMSQANKDAVHEGLTAFISYLESVKQELINLRLFERISYEYKIIKVEGKRYYVEVFFKFYDSHSLLFLPKPSLNTNEGFELKLKLKDANFLGMLNPLGVDLNIKLGNKDEPENFSKITLGTNFNYDLPFNLGITRNTWSNSFTLDWELDNPTPDFNYTTGVTIGVPIGRSQVNFNVNQAIIQDSSYEKFGDSFYFVENASISLPLVLGYIDLSAVKYTPSLVFNWNWDSDGINIENTDLCQTPSIYAGQSISVSKINWSSENNFRNGFSFNTSEYIGWNFRAETINEKVTPYLEVKAQAFKSFRYVGFATNVYLFAGLNKNTKIGSSLRGAADYQKFNTTEPIDANNYALETPGALVINFDIPVHIITTNWLKWGKAIFGSYSDLSPKMRKVFALPHKIFSVLDFELQLSPFVDIGFIQNRATNHFFYYKEGIYTTGIEMLVYPVKWRNYVVRASIGIDAGKKWLDEALGLDSSYRKSAKNWEAYFGLGTQF